MTKNIWEGVRIFLKIRLLSYELKYVENALESSIEFQQDTLNNHEVNGPKDTVEKQVFSDLRLFYETHSLNLPKPGEDEVATKDK